MWNRRHARLRTFVFVIYGALVVDAHEKWALVEVLDENVVGARISW